jgi:hypothetical protein
MNRFWKYLSLFLLGAAVIGGGTAIAATEGSNLIPPGAPAGYLKINPATCKFVHPEIDVRPSPTERYARAEDSRDDVKLSCLTNKIDKARLGAPGPRGPRGLTGATGPAGPAGAPGGLSGYVIVSAAINFKQASATVSCPSGDKVLGGGANVEVEGSYPVASGSGWVVTRDHTWGTLKSGSVFATCAS